MLRADDGEPTPATGLVLPGSRAAELLDDRVLAPVDPTLVDRLGARTCSSRSASATDLALTVVSRTSSSTPARGLLGDATATPPSSPRGPWTAGTTTSSALAERLGADAFVGDLVAVADLDAVRDDAWPQRRSAHLAGEPDLRRALLEPVRAEGTSPGATAPSYTAWWLRHRAPDDLDLREPFALPGADAALERARPSVHRPGSPAWPAPTAARWTPRCCAPLGGVASLEDLDAAGWTDLLDALGPAGTRVEPARAAALWRALARAAADGVRLEALPERLPALVGPADVAARARRRRRGRRRADVAAAHRPRRAGAGAAGDRRGARGPARPAALRGRRGRDGHHR